ncbi:unnamed protein product [Ostreobium quekettii]|uniref:Uncharacterized protein n=1 Tax=Ostreobium quekettii TaxID=121088 RepID=A0A8S1IY17_9CHLO|nr:unnamed protein product [Ostreobium quekettii]|eukprot:evm.model.scf_1160.4 EVM.evm.TU.scf_1160.4   scf_1160:42760-49627(-)
MAATLFDTKPGGVLQGRSGAPAASPTLEDRLCGEVLRKLRLACESVPEDRETICEEVFSDITGALDSFAREVLGSTGRLSFYEILADYYLTHWSAADQLLAICRRIWGQPFVAAIYTLLLHQWLLESRDAGGAEQRQKHLNVLVSGARQLFWIDVHASTLRFRPLYHYTFQRLKLRQDSIILDLLPATARTALVTLIACFMPYYVEAQDMPEAVGHFPSPDPTLHSDQRSSRDGDFLFSQITDTLRAIGGEPGLLRYIKSLAGLKSCRQLKSIRTVTQLRLQAELYSLSSPGGPRYTSRPVRHAALHTLDSLFPSGRTSRHVVALLFRLLHPLEWPASVAAATRRWYLGVQGRVFRAAAAIAAFLWMLWCWLCSRVAGLWTRR